MPIDGAVLFTPRLFHDDRGLFCEYFRADGLEAAVGRTMQVVQANNSVSRRGTLRGVHFSDVPPGQAKYVSCPRGAVLDVVVDLRTGSPTFAEHAAVVLDDVERRALYLAEGLGHAFFALTDDASVTYLCSTSYAPGREHAVHPLDPALRLPWPTDITPVLSDKDAAAPTLQEAQAAGVLPRYADCLTYYAESRRSGQ